jgi:hypothetical protein
MGDYPALRADASLFYLKMSVETVHAPSPPSPGRGRTPEAFYMNNPVQAEGAARGSNGLLPSLELLRSSM